MTYLYECDRCSGLIRSMSDKRTIRGDQDTPLPRENMDLCIGCYSGLVRYLKMETR